MTTQKPDALGTAGALALLLGAFLILDGDLWLIPVGILVMAAGYALQFSGAWNWYGSMLVLVFAVLYIVRAWVLSTGIDNELILEILLASAAIYLIGRRDSKNFHGVRA
ncbi:hypothetical protein O8W32_00345 [Methanomassiliicoccales archaeon LGM-DZ1]|nr:hypothetical protein O8W32_00345 [Methanomassiliicoccales archaeon LGM-DZ1]